jgi:O-antigen/teichoic acid export membrane protein
MADFKKKFAKNMLITGFFSYSAQAVSLGASTIHSRLLNPSDYGTVALIAIFIGLVGIFADSGISYAIIRTNHGLRYFRLVHHLAVGVGLLLFGVVSLLAPLVSLFFNGDASLIAPTVAVGAQFLVRGFGIVPQAWLVKQLATGFIGKVNLTVALVQAVLVVVLAWLGWSYWALIVPMWLGAGIQVAMVQHKAALSLPFRGWKQAWLGYQLTKHLINHAMGFNVINYGARKTDNLLIGKRYGDFELGLYDRAYLLLTTAINLISNLFGSILLPSLKELMPDKARVRAEYADMMKLFSLITFPAGLLLIFFGRPLTLLLWGADWESVHIFLPYIGILVCSQVVYSNAGYMFILFEEEKRFFRLGLWSSVSLVSGIAIGAAFSPLAVMIGYCAAYLCIVLPLYAYQGYSKAFGYPAGFILKFWAPKIACSLLLFAGAVWAQNWATYLGTGLYAIHLTAESYNLAARTIRKLVGWVR